MSIWTWSEQREPINRETRKALGISQTSDDSRKTNKPGKCNHCGKKNHES